MRQKMRQGSPRSWFDVLEQEANRLVGQGQDPGGVAVRKPRKGLVGRAPVAGQDANIWD